MRASQNRPLLPVTLAQTGGRYGVGYRHWVKARPERPIFSSATACYRPKADGLIFRKQTLNDAVEKFVSCPRCAVCQMEYQQSGRCFPFGYFHGALKAHRHPPSASSPSIANSLGTFDSLWIGWYIISLTLLGSTPATRTTRPAPMLTRQACCSIRSCSSVATCCSGALLLRGLRGGSDSSEELVDTGIAHTPRVG